MNLDALRRLFKSSPVTRTIVMALSGNPVWMTRDVATFAEEGYRRNVYVYACVREIALACAGIPWVLYRRVGGELEEISDHPLLDLLARPNPTTGWAGFVEQVISYLMISGNSYIHGVAPETGPRARIPAELWPLRPDRVRIIVGTADQPVAGYQYSAGGQTVQLPAEEVLHLKLFNPLDDWYGMSPIEAIARSVDHNNEARKWNVGLLQNSARPSGAFVFEGVMTEEQMERLRAQLYQRSGPEGAGRWLVLEGGAKWQEMSVSPKDMDWLEGMKLSAREIAIGFGVPPELIGDTANKTYSNYREARKAFYTETVLPLMDWFRDHLNAWLVRKFGDDLWLDYDRDEIEALQEDRQAVWERLIRADWLTINEKRRAVGYEEIPGGDVILAPISVVPLLSMATGKGLKALGLETEEAKTAYWKQIDRRREAWINAVQRQVAKQLENERRGLARVVRDAPNPGAAEVAADMFLDRASHDWEALLLAAYLSVSEAFAEDIARNLKGIMPEEFKQTWMDEVLRYLRDIAGLKIRNIVSTTRKKVREILAAGVGEGLGTDALAKKLAEEIAEFNILRAERIARTEVIGASNLGSRAAAKASGLPLVKEWLATRDGRTRESHVAIDGQRKPLDEPYSNGLMFPGDARGPAGEVINCRCTEIYHVIKT